MVSTPLGVAAIVFYLAVYLLMNLAAFAVIVARERETGARRRHRGGGGLGATRPLLAWPMTIAMLSLAGFPVTAGFFGKVYLIQARGRQRLRLARRGDRARLGDLARLLPAGGGGDLDARAGRGAGGRGRRARRGPARPAIAGGSAEADADPDALAATTRLGAPERRLRAARGRGASGSCARPRRSSRDLAVAAARSRAGRRGGVHEPLLALGRRRDGAGGHAAADVGGARGRTSAAPGYGGCDPSPS